MDWVAMLTDIFNVCVIPLLSVLTMYVVKHIQVKTNEITGRVNCELGDKYIQMLAATIESCVIATNQTYVDSLKSSGKFDAEAQKTAFHMTKTAVMNILGEDAKKYLSNAVGDLNEYITQQIEAAVNVNKSVG